MIKEAMRRQHAEKLKFLAQNYKDQRQIDKLRSEQIKMIEEANRRQEQEQILQQNKPKVEQRQIIEKFKQQEKLHLIEEKKQEPIRQQQKLDKAVENYSFRPQVELDSERVKQEIKAREIRKNTGLDKADQVQLFKNNGFTVDKLMKDVRYKISSALHDAGLSQTTYGQQVIKGIGPTKAAPMQKSSLKLY